MPQLPPVFPFIIIIITCVFVSLSEKKIILKRKGSAKENECSGYLTVILACIQDTVTGKESC